MTKDKEYFTLVEGIRRHFPDKEQDQAIENLDFILQAANLRGQRNALHNLVVRENDSQKLAQITEFIWAIKNGKGLAGFDLAGKLIPVPNNDYVRGRKDGKEYIVKWIETLLEDTQERTGVFR